MLRSSQAPAAFCRKAITSKNEVEMWGDGLQTRSFTFIDDCVEGVLRLMFSECDMPINLGTTEMVSMNEVRPFSETHKYRQQPTESLLLVARSSCGS